MEPCSRAKIVAQAGLLSIPCNDLPSDGRLRCAALALARGPLDVVVIALRGPSAATKTYSERGRSESPDGSL